jgi:transcription-repair coupling factor (superfamily II helicase)
VNGLTPPAKALAVAAAAHRAADAVVLLVVPSDADLEAAATDVRFFLGALEGLSDVSAERAVLPFPSQQVDPYRGLAPHFRVASARARALHAAALGQARVIVASAQALIPRLPAPESVVATSFDLRLGVELDPQALAEILVEGGYERQDPVDEHGEFSVRGGILDVYPAGEDSPVRIEFVGDTVESIRRFDPGTQRSIETLDQFQIVPVREPGSGADTQSNIFDYLRASRGMRVVVAETQDVRVAVEKWWEQVSASFEERENAQNSAAPAKILLPWSDVEPVLSAGSQLEELAIGESSD